MVKRDSSPGYLLLKYFYIMILFFLVESKEQQVYLKNKNFVCIIAMNFIQINI